MGESQAVDGGDSSRAETRECGNAVFTEATNARRFLLILIEIVRTGHVKQRKI
jgi:hypothetical protein